MVKHYTGPIGDFYYDDKLWQLANADEELHWIGGNQECNLPNGITSCQMMFGNCTLGEGFSFGDFDTSSVTNMSGMFLYAKLPVSISFDTSKVTTMEHMFAFCELPDGFSLGDNFDTHSVTDMSGMFSGVELPDGFQLGDKFDVSNVVRMLNTFDGCLFNEDLVLNLELAGGKVRNAGGMFKRAKLPKNIKVAIMDKCSCSNMFFKSVIPVGSQLYIDLANNTENELTNMFKECKLPSDFLLSNPWVFDAYSMLDDVFIRDMIYDETMCCYIDFEDYVDAIVDGGYRHNSPVYKKAKYKFFKITDAGFDQLHDCKTLSEFMAIVAKYCKVQ